MRHPLLRRDRDHFNFAAEQKEERKRRREEAAAVAEKEKEALLAKANQAATGRTCLFWKQGKCAIVPPGGSPRLCKKRHGTAEETAAIRCYTLSESGKKLGWVCDPSLCPYDHTPVSSEKQAVNEQSSMED